jgi:hypothetical protein
MMATHIEKMLGAFGARLTSGAADFAAAPLFRNPVRSLGSLWRRRRRAALGNVRFRGTGYSQEFGCYLANHSL